MERVFGMNIFSPVKNLRKEVLSGRLLKHHWCWMTESAVFLEHVGNSVHAKIPKLK